MSQNFAGFLEFLIPELFFRRVGKAGKVFSGRVENAFYPQI